MTNKLFIILAILSMVAWGATWVSAKFIAGMTTPEVLAFWRFTITFFSMIPILIFKRESLKLSKQTALLVILGAVFMVLYNQLMFAGLEHGLAGASGVLVASLNPVFTFILGIFFYRNRVQIKEVIGLAIGIIAGLLLLQFWTFKNEELLLNANLLFVISALVWSLMTICSQKAQQKTSAFVFSFYLYGIAAVIDLFLARNDGVMDVFQMSATFWINIVFISIFATTFATTAYFYSSKKLGAHKASSYMFLVPINAVLLSYFILNERPKLATLIGGVLAIIAVYLINQKKREQVKSSERKVTSKISNN